jgi:capsular polysaccharide export protein
MRPGARHFLLLQGGVSPFFARLAAQLERSGHRVSRLNFCAGDRLLWPRPGAIAVREPVDGLRNRLASICRALEVTDLMLLGADRPVHRPAVGLAEELGLRAHLVDEGYLRPNWLTIERAGLPGAAPLPRDPDWYRRLGPRLPARATPGRRLRPMRQGDLTARALWGAAYQLARLADPLLFPHYRSHRPDHPLAEIWGWLRRFSRLPMQRAADSARIEALIDSSAPLFLLPLQLRGDAQVRCHSRFQTMAALIERVVRSFAQHASADAQLLIKNHPLDSGLEDHASQVRRAAEAAGCEARVHYVETGALPGLLDAAAGLVTINSTSGLAALLQHCPTLVLGQAIYDLPGLTFQGGLDRFWREPRAPDPDLVDAFRRVLIHSSQLPGNLYTASGIRLALQGIEPFLAVRSPLEGLLARCPTSACETLHGRSSARAGPAPAGALPAPVGNELGVSA